MGAEAVDVNRSGLWETQWLLMELDTSQRPAAHFQAIAVTSIHVHTVWEGELTAPFVFHKFSWLQLFTPSTKPPPHPPTQPLPHKHARSSTSTSQGHVRPSIHSTEASCTPGDRPRWWCWLKSGRTGREEEEGGVGKGRAQWKGSQACPSGSAQPAHSSSFSTGASAGMSPHVRDHCLEAGLLVWLKRPFRSINTDESQMCCVQFPKVMLFRTWSSAYEPAHPLKSRAIASASGARLFVMQLCRLFLNFCSSQHQSFQNSWLFFTLTQSIKSMILQIHIKKSPIMT